jgi:hypothetical protein
MTRVAIARVCTSLRLQIIPTNNESTFFPVYFQMGKRKRGPTKKKKGDAKELTFGDEASETELPSTQTFTFLGSGSGRKDRTTRVRGRHGAPEIPQPLNTAVFSASAPDSGLLADGFTVDDRLSEYDDDFSVAFNATEMHFDDGEEDLEDVEAIEAETEKEILAGVSAYLISTEWPF